MERKRLLKLSGSILLVLVLVALALGGCAKPVGEAKPINIGVSSDMSGVAAECGMEEIPMIEMVVDEVNAAGGINGRPIKLFITDNASDPAKAVGFLKKYVELNKCVALNFGVTSTVGLAVKPWVEEHHIPTISPDPQSDKLIHREGKSWWFRTNIPSETSVAAGLLRMKELGYTKVGFEGTALAWGTDQLATLERLVPEYGIEFIGSVLCEPKTKDLTIQAMKLRDTGAKALMQGEYVTEMGVWARALKDIGWKPYIYTAGPNLAPAMEVYPVELFEGWECWDLMDSTKPLTIEVWDRYAACTGKRYDTSYTARAYDSIMLLVEALKLSGNPDDPEAIRDGLYKIKDLPVATGRKDTLGSFEIGRNHLLSLEDVPIYVVKSGKRVIVK